MDLLEQPGKLFLYHFRLVTNVAERRCWGAQLLDQNCRRSEAKVHFGKLMTVLNLTLSARPRP